MRVFSVNNDAKERRVKKIPGRGKTIVLGLDTRSNVFFLGKKGAM